MKIVLNKTGFMYIDMQANFSLLTFLSIWCFYNAWLISLHFSDYVVQLPQDGVIGSIFYDGTKTKDLFSICMSTWFLLSKRKPFPFIYSTKEKQANKCANYNIWSKVYY